MSWDDWLEAAYEDRQSSGEWEHELEDDEEEFHDGGMIVKHFYNSTTYTPDCECGWKGEETQDLDAAFRERDEHERMAS